jgi:hypothetical protein
MSSRQAVKTLFQKKKPKQKGWGIAQVVESLPWVQSPSLNKKEMSPTPKPRMLSITPYSLSSFPALWSIEKNTGLK